MQESEFNKLVDNTFEQVEFALDDVDGDHDYESSGGVLTVEFANDTTMVFSRQVANQQLWLAARSGGYHFSYDPEAADWCCTRSGALFKEFVPQQMREQAGVELQLA